jgi:hypothetical protein
VNGCSPVCRLSARASWRPQYPLLTQCTWRSLLATENGRVCRLVDRGRDSTTSHPEVQHQNVLNKRATACHINKKVACFVLCAVGGFVSASYHYCRFSDPRLKWGVIRVFRAVRRKCAQIDGLSVPIRMVPEPLRYDQSSNYAPCQTGIIRYSEPRASTTDYSRIRPSWSSRVGIASCLSCN